MSVLALCHIRHFDFVYVPTFHDNAIGFCYPCIGACDSIKKSRCAPGSGCETVGIVDVS